MDFRDLILESLQLPVNAIAYQVSRRLREDYPNHAITEGPECSFDIEKYAEAGHCQLQPLAIVHNQFATHWRGHCCGLKKTGSNVYFEVTWQGQRLLVLVLNWFRDWSEVKYSWVIAKTQQLADSFFAEVCHWNTQVRDEVLIFENGGWHKSKELYQSIQASRFETLTLSGTLKQDIYNDLIHFFSAQATYAEYGIPWKRGVLLIGPPGNGKTHTVKALVNALGKPCLYAKNFKHRWEPDVENIRKVFEGARDAAPCILVLEDLDSLITEENRSFFLNELDGFAPNEGILTLATTNHPDRLDVAILERPSRFDRKYYFELPAPMERSTYIQFWEAKLRNEMKLREGAIAHLVQETEGFSFAYLKELFLSSMVEWMTDKKPGSMDVIMAVQLQKLREQMKCQAQAEEAGTDKTVEAQQNGAGEKNRVTV